MRSLLPAGSVKGWPAAHGSLRPSIVQDLVVVHDTSAYRIYRETTALLRCLVEPVSNLLPNQAPARSPSKDHARDPLMKLTGRDDPYEPYG